LHPSKILKKVIPHCTPQAIEYKKELVPKFVEKPLTTNKLSTSCTKEEDKVHQDAIIMKDEFKPGQPIMFSSSKKKLLLRRLKTKGSSLWVIKEIGTGGLLNSKVHILKKN